MISLTHKDNNAVDTLAPTSLVVVKGQRVEEKPERSHDSSLI